MSGKPITTLTNTTESEKTIVAQSVEAAPAAVHESAAASGTSRGAGGVGSRGKKTGGRKKGSKPLMKTKILEQPTEVTGKSPKGKGRMLMVVKAICAIREKHAPAPVIAHVDIDGGRVKGANTTYKMRGDPKYFREIEQELARLALIHNSTQHVEKKQPEKAEKPATASMSGGGPAKATGWSKSGKKKAKQSNIVFVEVPKDHTKAPGVALKKMGLKGFSAWIDARPVEGKEGVVSIKVSCANFVDEEVKEKYLDCIDNLVASWSAIKYRLKNVDHLKIILSKAVKEFGVKYQFAGKSKDGEWSFVTFQASDGGLLEKEVSDDVYECVKYFDEEHQREQQVWKESRFVFECSAEKFRGLSIKLEKYLSKAYNSQKYKERKGTAAEESLASDAIGVRIVQFRFKPGDRTTTQYILGYDEKAEEFYKSSSDEEYQYTKTIRMDFIHRKMMEWQVVFAKKDEKAEAKEFLRGAFKRLFWRWGHWKIGATLEELAKIHAAAGTKAERVSILKSLIEKQVAKEEEAAARRIAHQKDLVERKRVAQEEFEKRQNAAQAQGKVCGSKKDQEGAWGGVSPKKTKSKGKKVQKPKSGTIAFGDWNQEFRIDTADGNAYPRESFLKVYGEFGQERWEKAVKTTATPEPVVEPEPAPAVVETPPEVVVDVSLKSNRFAALMTPRDFTA